MLLYYKESEEKYILEEIRFQDLHCFDPVDRQHYHQILDNIFDSGNFLLGEYTHKFILDFQQFANLNAVIPVGSGTSALEIILKRLKSIGFNEVACAANAGGYASVAARLNNMEISFVDVDELTGLITTEQLVRAYEKKNFEILVYTHLYGNGQDLTNVVEFCKSNKIILVEDCAQAAGLRINGRHVGSFGEYAAFSFFPTKNLGAFGDAGAIACSETERPFIQSIAQYGWVEKYNIEIDKGTNSRIDEFQAAILSHRINKLESQNQQRCKIVQKYQSNIPDDIGHMIYSADSVAHLAVLFCKDREKIMRNLYDDQIPYSVHYPVPDHHQKAWKRHFSSTSLPNTEKLSAGVLSLPLHLNLSDENLSRILESLTRLSSH
jgi:aminotransferase EvaB